MVKEDIIRMIFITNGVFLHDSLPLWKNIRTKKKITFDIG